MKKQQAINLIANDIFVTAFGGNGNTHLLRWKVIELMEQFGPEKLGSLPGADGNAQAGITKQITQVCQELAEQVQAGTLKVKDAAIKLMPDHDLLNNRIGVHF